MRTVHTYQQGSQEWLQHRAAILNASEAPALMGASKYQTRSDLMRQKATGLAPEVDAATQALFNRGHAVEAPTVALIEDAISDSLAPVVASIQIDGLTLGASYDGLSMLEDTAAEVKLWNQDLAEQVRRGELDPHYFWQLEHQFIVTPSLERIIFATSDGTPERFVWMEYRPLPGRRAQLLAAWRQFRDDLATYQPREAEPPKPTGRAPETLPALRIEITGAVTASNLADFKATALGAIRSVNRELSTDQQFADAEQAVKWCAEVESRIKAAKEHALSQTATIDELFRTLDDVSAEARKVRLDLEKLVTRRKEEIKGEMVAAAKSAYQRHEDALRQECGAWIVLTQPDFGGAIKGKRSVSAMQDALDTTLANAKIVADESARKIRAALQALAEESNGFEHLFADRLSFVSKAPEDVRALACARITEHRAAEERRAAELAERERERIRQEEEAKARAAARAEQEAAACVERERQETIAREQRQREDEAARAQAQQQPAVAPAPTVVQMPTTNPPADDGARINLSQIKDRLHPIQITAEGLAQLGIQSVGQEKASRLYRASDFPRICDVLIAHIQSVLDQRAAA